MENKKGSHKEEIWVENLCKKINESENFTIMNIDYAL